MATEKTAATVLEYLMLAERKSFIDALRTCRSRMLEEDQSKDCAKSAIACLSSLSGMLGVGAIAVGSFGSGIGVIALAGTVFLAAKKLDKGSNHAPLEGEQILWTTTDIKAWLAQAWQAGYPIGQILTAYSDFCEEIYISQMTRPKWHNRLKSAEGFVRTLNKSPDQFSALPPVVKVGEVKLLPMPLEDEPVSFSDGLAQVLDAIEEEPVRKVAPVPPEIMAKISKHVEQRPTPVWDDEAIDDGEVEKTMEAIARSFSPPVAQEAQSMEQRIQSMNRNEQHAGDAAIRIRESFRDDPSKLHRGLPDVVTEQRNCVIYGNPGTGKGVQLSNAIRELKRISPDVHVFAIDPKNDPKEDGYWEVGYDTLRRKDILRMRPNAAAEWVYKCVEEFQMMKGPRLLIWDEVMTSVAAFKSAKGEKALDENGKFTGEWVYRPGTDLLDDINFWATGWVSSGDSRSIRAWFITQSGNLDDLPFNGGTKTQLRQVILARDTDEQLVGKMGENKTLRKGQADMNVVIQACQRSPVSRAIYVSDIGAWMPLAKLPILCGWNRDEGKSIS